jgi:hypothetical protein
MVGRVKGTAPVLAEAKRYQNVVVMEISERGI